MISYQKEKLIGILDVMMPMLEKHWDEVAGNKDKIKLDPDYNTYLKMESEGYLHVYTARDEGRLIGYSIFIVTYHLHYQTVKYANNDIIYIEPGYRKSEVGAGLIAQAEQGLMYDEGVDVIMMSMKAKKPFEKTMTRQGYSLFEYNYAKYVGGGE